MSWFWQNNKNLTNIGNASQYFDWQKLVKKCTLFDQEHKIINLPEAEDESVKVYILVVYILESTGHVFTSVELGVSWQLGSESGWPSKYKQS